MKIAESEIHLIPYPYRGQVTISFEISDGLLEKRDDKNNRIYEINQDGKLYTQFATNIGIRPNENFTFYWVEDNGNKIPLPHASTLDNEPDAIVVSNVYLSNKKLYYFVDSVKNINSYKNPTIDENERKSY